MKFRFEWKNFLLGIGTMLLTFCIPKISDIFITFTTMIRDKIGGK